MLPLPCLFLATALCPPEHLARPDNLSRHVLLIESDLPYVLRASRAAVLAEQAAAKASQHGDSSGEASSGAAMTAAAAGLPAEQVEAAMAGARD